MGNTHSLDLVAVLTLLAGVVFGPALAAVVGPYAVIVLGAALGGAWSSSRREPTTRVRTAAYLLGMIALALIITVPLTELAARYAGIESRWLLGPVAVVVAGVGDKWPDVVRWGLGVLRSIVEQWATKRNNNGGQQ